MQISEQQRINNKANCYQCPRETENIKNDNSRALEIVSQFGTGSRPNPSVNMFYIENARSFKHCCILAEDWKNERSSDALQSFP